MKKENITAKEAMGLMEELNRYPVGSIYTSTRKSKSGETGCGKDTITFYYDDIHGGKKRKTLTGKKEEELIPLRAAFLTELFYQKQELKRKSENMELLKEVLPPSLLKEEARCERAVKDVMEDYLASHKGKVKYKTHTGEISASKHVVKWIGDKRVNELTGADYQNLLNEVAKGRNGKRASKKTVSDVKGCFSRMIRFCKKSGWITSEFRDDILEDVDMPVTARKDKNAKYLSMEDMGAVLNALKDNRRYYLIVKILLLTGMRGQEIFALERSDLLVEKGMVNIRHALEEQERKQEVDRRYILGETKNEESQRYAPAVEEVFTCFRELEKIQEEEGWREKAYKNGNGKLAVIDSKGQIVDKTAFNRNLGLYLSRRGFAKRLTLHMPRHCYTTYLKLLGADVENVELSLGHSVNGVRGEYLADLTPDYINMLLPKIKEMADSIREKEGLKGAV